ncbi:MAG TPA: hypothetical protein PLO62_15610, partial [Candidatus Hydrogenedentes bacterium]|nr:hypothetical protein [Candidatus Hydrogenedentota bacterium]
AQAGGRVPVPLKSDFLSIGYALAKAYLLAKFGIHALLSRKDVEVRTRFRAIWLSGLEYPLRF